jgi:GntR family transcriptional repressor for pyruvate dehydrogenase complex
MSGLDQVPLVLRHHDAVGQIATHLRQLIANGVWKPGEKLPSEAELAAHFTVARGTVREALKNLGASGLLQTTRGNTGGTFVALPTVGRLTSALADSIRMRQASGPITVDEIDEARLHLERACVQLAAERRTGEDLALMRDAVDRSRDLARERAEWLELNNDFHAAIASAAKNEILQIAMSAVHIARPFEAGAPDVESEYRLRTIRQHEALIDAIQRQDPAEAVRLLEEHVRFLHGSTSNKYLPK